MIKIFRDHKSQYNFTILNYSATTKYWKLDCFSQSDASMLRWFQGNNDKLDEHTNMGAERTMTKNSEHNSEQSAEDCRYMKLKQNPNMYETIMFANSQHTGEFNRSE